MCAPFAPLLGAYTPIAPELKPQKKECLSQGTLFYRVDMEGGIL